MGSLESLPLTLGLVGDVMCVKQLTPKERLFVYMTKPVTCSMVWRKLATY